MQKQLIIFISLFGVASHACIDVPEVSVRMVRRQDKTTFALPNVQDFEIIMVPKSDKIILQFKGNEISSLNTGQSEDIPRIICSIMGKIKSSCNNTYNMRALIKNSIDQVISKNTCIPEDYAI